VNVDYGAGLLEVIPPELFEVTEEEEEVKGATRYRQGVRPPPSRKKSTRPPHQALREAYLLKAAAIGLSHVFVERIDEEIVEITCKNRQCSARWLPAAEAAPYLRAIALRGNLPYVAKPAFLDADFYIPSYTLPHACEITWPELSAPCLVDGLRAAIRQLHQSIPSLPEMDRLFAQDLVAAMELCEAQRLIFWFWYS